jgi:hypothetical protein
MDTFHALIVIRAESRSSLNGKPIYGRDECLEASADFWLHLWVPTPHGGNLGLLTG